MSERSERIIIATLVPDAVGALTPWVDAGVLGPLEVHGTEAIVRIGAGPDAPAAPTDVVLALALALWAPLHGHACIDLADAPAIVAAGTASDADTIDDTDSTAVAALEYPEPARWVETVAASTLVRRVTEHDHTVVADGRAFVLHGASLYTQRQWADECVVATALAARATPPELASPGRAAGTPADPQRLATDAAARAALTVVVGGPGTGKTFTIARLLAELLAADDGLRIGLAAPTGKAAERMTASIRALAADAGAPAGVTARLVALEAVTLHRLLGWRPGSHTRFRHDAANPLPYDIVVIDETSMVPLPMMARLLEATSAATRLVLVGDPDQLESVEVGAVLGDIVRAEALRSNVFRLERQYRTAVGSPIAELAALIRAGRADDVIALARSGVAGLTYVTQADGAAAVSAAVLDELALARDAAITGDAAAALAHAGMVRVLCAHRRGPFGVEEWNRTVRRWVHGSQQRAQAGDVLLATRNDPRTRTVNGDTGVLVDRGNALMVAFPRAGAIAVFAPAQIAGLEPAFAMTVHKTQGSEYDTVAVIHPPESSPLVGRELLYTAVTRASRRLVIVGDDAAIRRAVLTPAHRVSGLAAALDSER